MMLLFPNRMQATAATDDEVKGGEEGKDDSKGNDLPSVWRPRGVNQSCGDNGDDGLVEEERLRASTETVAISARHKSEYDDELDDQVRRRLWEARTQARPTRGR